LQIDRAFAAHTHTIAEYTVSQKKNKQNYFC